LRWRRRALKFRQYGFGKGREREKKLTLCEAQGEHETNPDVDEDLGPAGVDGLVASVVSSKCSPTGCETEDGAREREDRACLGGTTAHGDVLEVSRSGEDAGDDEKDDEARYPGNHFVVVHDLVAEEGDDEGACCDDDDASPTWDVRVDGMDQLGSDDDVDG
jgi:hypothetical protein